MRDSHLHLATGEGLKRLKWEWEEERTHYPDLLCFGTADMDYGNRERASRLSYGKR